VKSQQSTSGAAQTAPEFFSTDVAEARRFYLDLNPPRNRQLVVVCGGIERCTPGYAIRRETFPFYSIEYAARGRGEVKLKGRAYSLKPGRLFSYGPGIPHQITGDAAEPLVKYFVDFAGTRAQALLRSCGLPGGRVSEVFPSDAPRALFDELIEAGLRVRPESAELCAKLLECLALRIAGARAPLAGAETHAFATYQHCRAYVEQHALRLRTLEQMAGECHVNNAYLCRLFRRYDNQSPYQYLLRLKMNYAAERLKQPGALVKQVAEESGYADPFHFSRVFTSVFGLSPTAFHRLGQGNL
jgi:AraC-like DNA-binding protein/quercetin dioxygenase-like cupin family protein